MGSRKLAILLYPGNAHLAASYSHYVQLPDNDHYTIAHMQAKIMTLQILVFFVDTNCEFKYHAAVII